MKTDPSKKPFLWGAATSSFQIEGAGREDGKGLSIWDDFCRQPGKVSDKSNGMVACDHYHRYQEDVELMKSLGLNAYRFSIAWPRILPAGVGKVETKGLDFYDRLVDTLLVKDIKPFPTLYHWDLPLELHHRGGWTNPDMPAWFEEYSAAVLQRLGDRILDWTTLNEPHVFTFLGYQIGNHAPGHTSRMEYLKALRNALLAHGKASQVIHGVSPAHRVGIANAHLCVEPLNASFTSAADVMDQFTNRIWMEPIVHGTIPEAVKKELDRYEITLDDRDLRTIHQPLEFAGVNYYMRMLASTTENPERPFMMQHPDYPGAEKTAIGWEVYPLGLEKVLAVYKDLYGNIETYVTENGASYPDGPNDLGNIEDLKRVDYYKSHLEALENARAKGCNVQGYFAWSFMDNFEWAHGYSQRFGIIHVDYANNCKRTPKRSALWYRDHIQGKTRT